MELHISKDIDGLSIAVAGWMVDWINKILQTQNRCCIALSGGSTPKKLNELLTTEKYKDKIDWSKVHIFFGDERFVPFSDASNNAKMAFDTLLDHVNVPKEQIHIMQTENITPEQSAEDYESLLKNYFPSPGNNQTSTFDIIFLGMGDDGHTLSLFPGETEIIHEDKKWCTSLWLPAQNMHRVTLTHPVANNSKAIIFLASGDKKAEALKEVLNGDYNPDKYPSQIINAANGELHWFVDEAAAKFL